MSACITVTSMLRDCAQATFRQTGYRTNRLVEDMKLILLEDVKNVGQIGEIAEVPAGYGRNFLIPQGMAQLATRSVLRSAELKQQLKASQERRERIEAEGQAEALQGATLMIGARVGARNRLHGEVTNQDVADAIREEIGVEIDRHKIEIERPIRSLGMFMLPVRIAKGLEASITVEILEESELAARLEAERAAESEEAEEEAEGADDDPDYDLFESEETYT